MVAVFEFDNYRKFLVKRINEAPHRGFGQVTKIARFLGVHSTLVSQILKGKKELTTDQAVLIADFFALGELEAEYFVLLVQLERAGNQVARLHYRKQVKRVKEQAQSVSQRVTAEAKLSEEQRAVFYSDWAYSAVRQSVAIPRISGVDAIGRFLGLPERKVRMLMNFLTATGLCKLTSDGHYKIGPTSTHLESASSWVRVHHTNWRIQAMQALDAPRASDLHYTSPLTLSHADAEILRERIIQFIQQVNSIVDPSPSEVLQCFNIDWFQVGNPALT